MTAKTYRVKGIDLHIDGEHIPEGSEIELTAEPGRKLRRWLEPLDPVEPVKPVKESKSKAQAKDDKQADGNKDGQGEDKQPDDKAEETKA